MHTVHKTCTHTCALPVQEVTAKLILALTELITCALPVQEVTAKLILALTELITCALPVQEVTVKLILGLTELITCALPVQEVTAELILGLTELITCALPVQEVTVKLILALTELLLCPTVTSCALVQLDACFDALINSWGPGCRTQQGGDSQESTEHVWRGVAMQKCLSDIFAGSGGGLRKDRKEGSKKRTRQEWHMLGGMHLG
eukprot:1141309-Pelagomonas_calceolata.AAC.4